MYSSGGCLTTTGKCAAQMACHVQCSSVVLAATNLYLLAARVGSLPQLLSPTSFFAQFTWGGGGGGGG